MYITVNQYLHNHEPHYSGLPVFLIREVINFVEHACCVDVHNHVRVHMHQKVCWEFEIC